MMSDDDGKVLLERQRVQLIRDINIRDGLLLAHLRARGALTSLQEEEIKGERDKSRRTGRLLDMLLKGDCDTVDKFVHSLRASNQSHIVEKFLRAPRHPDKWGPFVDAAETTGSASTNVLSKTDRNILETARPHLMTRLDLTDGKLFEQLRYRHVLTKPEQDRIKDEEENANQVGLLVHFVLRKSQDTLEDFLHALKDTGHSEILEQLLRPPRKVDPLIAGDYLHEGLSTDTQNLADVLRDNLADKLKEWKTAIEEGVAEQGGQLVYVDQPCTREDNNQEYSSAVQLVEETRSGDRIRVFGEAGMGKTTLLKHLASSWVEKTNLKLVQKFDFVFLLPMRLVWKGSLLGLICEELKLIPASKMNDLNKTLCGEQNESKTLFLLDSYEELRKDVTTADHAEIDDLIVGKLFQKSTVIVTSRPGSKLPEQNLARLKDLPAERVKEIILQRYGEDEAAADRILRSFPAMSFLQKPINLALFLFVIRQNKQSKLLHTQAELLDMVMQYMMLAFAKKIELPLFVPQPRLNVINNNIPGDIWRVFRDIAEKCYQERKENNVMLHVEDEEERDEYLQFGLFTSGPENNTVLLPHPLFQEYLAAAHLAETPKAWEELYGQIREKSESEFNKPSLLQVLRPLGLENVVRFLVGLSPRVCEQIGSLFAIQRKEISFFKVSSFGCTPGRDYANSYALVNFKYYEELLRECTDERGRRVLAKALMEAPVRTLDSLSRFGDKDDGEMPTSSYLLSALDHDQRVTFLRNVHNIQLSMEDGQAVLSCAGNGNNFGIGDTFVVGILHVYDSVIKTEELCITSLELPARMLSRDVPGLLELTIEHCTLSEGIQDYMSDLQLPAVPQAPSPCDVNSSLERIHLYAVKGLEYCDTITSCSCELDLLSCGDVTVGSLKTCFPKLSVLELKSSTSVVYETEDEFLPWMATVQKMTQISIAPQNRKELQSLCHLLSWFAGRDELTSLELSNYTLLPGVTDVMAVTMANALSHLRLCRCEAKMDLCRVLGVCSHCPQLKSLSMDRCELRPAAGDTTDIAIAHDNSLCNLSLSHCEGDLDLVRVLEACSKFKLLEKLFMEYLDIRQISASDISEKNSTLSELELRYCERVLNLNSLLEVCSRCSKLRKVKVDNSDLVYDETRVGFAKELTGLQELLLKNSTITTPAGQPHDNNELARHFRTLLPSAKVDVSLDGYYRLYPEELTRESAKRRGRRD